MKKGSIVFNKENEKKMDPILAVLYNCIAPAEEKRLAEEAKRRSTDETNITK